MIHLFLCLYEYYKYNCINFLFYKYKNFKFQNFLFKKILKTDTMDESELQRVYNYKIYPGDSKIHSHKGFVNIDDGSMVGTHWKCFIVKHSQSYYFDSSGGQPDKFLIHQLPKPIFYHNYKKQDRNSKLCGSYCLYFLYSIERMNYYDVILKMYLVN